MHLTAAIFRAVEVQNTNHVIAANTGFSASIDGCGRLIACGPRRENQPHYASKWYQTGDGLFGSSGAVFCLGYV